MSVQLFHGDCLDILPTLEAGSVDMVLADPPYGQTACSWDSVIDLPSMWKELKRVIKPNGAIVLFGSQPFTSVLITSNLEWFRYEWVWEKENGTDFLNTNRKPFEVHENICLFYERLPLYSPQMGRGKPYRTVSGTAYRMGLQQPDVADGTVTVNTGGRYPRSVLRFNTQKGLHPTQKPVPLLAYLIRTYTNKGDTVLDFCMGSGSTLVACIEEGRNGIGIEKDAGYFEIAQKRIHEAETAPRTMEMELAV